MSYKAVEDLSQEFIVKTGLVPVFASELEFYFIGKPNKNKIASLNKAIKEAGFLVDDLEKESGKGQAEIQFRERADIVRLIQEINRFKGVVGSEAKKVDLEVNFKSKPFSDRAGSGMHFHLSLHNDKGINAFMFNKKGQYKNYLDYAIGGLLELTLPAIKYIATDANDYQRFLNPGIDTPNTVSWGMNNRSCAVRLPDVLFCEDRTRIEYRAPGSNSDPQNCIICILAGVLHGISNKILPSYDKIFGLASDAQYNLPKFPQDYDSACAIKSQFLDKIFKNS